MKKKCNFLILLFAAIMISSCGSKQSGKPNFGDDEYAVRTISGQSRVYKT